VSSFLLYGAQTQSVTFTAPAYEL